MKDARAALRYAKAILNLAKDSNSQELVDNDMKLIVTTIAQNDELEVVLNSPVIKATDKMKVLKALFSDKVDTISLGLFNLL
jgi:F-type H+-transporting ATPase subunit delta